jgi:hypothetical protein
VAARAAGERSRSRGPVRATEAALLELLAFTRKQGLLHMDTHFENVLTDGSALFLGDHGLALSRSFQLGAAELAFFERHQSYDRCTAINSLVHAVVAHCDAHPNGEARPLWRDALRELIAGSHAVSESLPDALRAYLVQRGPVALAMGEFYARLTADFSTEYPEAQLRALLGEG